MTNYEAIKAMDEEKLSEFLGGIVSCYGCLGYSGGGDYGRKVDSRSQSAGFEENQRTARSAVSGVADQLQQRNTVPGCCGRKGTDPGCPAQGVRLRKGSSGKVTGPGRENQERG